MSSEHPDGSAVGATELLDRLQRQAEEVARLTRELEAARASVEAERDARRRAGERLEAERSERKRLELELEQERVAREDAAMEAAHAEELDRQLQTAWSEVAVMERRLHRRRRRRWGLLGR